MAPGRLPNKRPLLALLLLLLPLAACTPGHLLYQWGPYQPISYQLMQQDPITLQEQIHAMEEHSRQVDSAGGKVPPGYHAQLGLLYAHTGNMERMRAEFMREKELFPESAVYMDFLLAEKNKPERQSEK